MPRDLVVESHDGVPLAVRDHGGEGRAVVLMHGAGAHLQAVERLAVTLRPYRVVTMDQRWSGQSGDGDLYRWEDLVRDVESVVAALGLNNPVVGGHSWGGMIAAHYAVHHPEVPAAFNLDGHGPGDISLYDGISEEEFDALSTQMARIPDYLGAEGDDAWKVQEAARMVEALPRYGVLPEDLETFAERSFLRLSEDRWRRRPSRVMYEALTGDQKMFELYERIEAPLLIVLAGGEDLGPPGLEHVMTAYRRGLRRAFDRLVGERTNVKAVAVCESGHNELAGAHASAVGRVVSEFLEDSGYHP